MCGRYVIDWKPIDDFDARRKRKGEARRAKREERKTQKRRAQLQEQPVEEQPLPADAGDADARESTELQLPGGGPDATAKGVVVPTARRSLRSRVGSRLRRVLPFRRK